MKNLVLKAGHFYRKDFDPENPTVRDIDLTLWMFHQLKEFGLNPNFACCPFVPDATVVNTDTRLVNPHVNGTDLCFDLLNVVTSATVSNAVCIPIAQLNITTTMVDNGNGTYTYTNEAGTTTTFNVGGTTSAPINVLTSNTINSTSIDVSTLPNQPACTGTKTYVLLNTDGTGATINASTGIVSINTTNFYPYCGKKKLSGHILCDTDIVGHFILDIEYSEYDEYEYDASCLFRDMQVMESTINGGPVLNSNNCTLPITSIIIDNIGSTNLSPEVFGTDALVAQLNAQQFYNNIPCASYKTKDSSAFILSVPKGTTPAPGDLTTKVFNRYTVQFFYEVLKLAIGTSIHNSYTDENLPLFESPTAINNTFTDLVLPANKVPGADSNNIHFIDGIYGTLHTNTKVNLFRTRGLKDMFRYTFSEFKLDGVTDGIGLNGYSNRGYNEIGGAPPLNIAAFNIFKRRLIEHITLSAQAQGYCIVCSIEDGTTTTVDNTNQLDRFFTLTIDTPTTMVLTHLSGHNLSSVAGAIGPLNEWGYADNGNPIHKIEDWFKDDIYLTTPSHMPTMTHVTTAGNAIITPAVNGIGGTTNFLSDCKHDLSPTGV